MSKSDSDTGPDASSDDAKHPYATADGAYRFGSEREHKVSHVYPVFYEDTLELTGASVTRQEGSDGVPGDGTDSTYECTCGACFATEDEATRHLKRRGRPVAPLPDCPRPFDFSGGNIIEGPGDQQVKTRPRAPGNPIVASVIDSEDYYTARARTVLRPPAEYAFDSWDELTEEGGTLYNPNIDDPQFQPLLLERAIATVRGDRVDYDPARYGLWYDGNYPLFVEGPSGGVLICPRSANPP